MTATANPNFGLQHQAIQSLRQVHRVCFGVEAFQVLLSLVVLLIGYNVKSPPVEHSTIRIVHLYAALFYVFFAVFAHVVVFYVLMAVGNNIKSAYVKNPGNVHEWLLVATGRFKKTLLPIMIAHGVALLVVVMSTSLWSTAPSPYHSIAAWSATGLGVAVFISARLELIRNARMVQSFVTNGGHSDIGVVNV